MAPSDYADKYEDYRVTFPQEHVAHVEINRPKKLNSLSPKMWPTMRQIFTDLSTDPDVRAIVLSGAGDRAFTAGLDVASASTSGPLSPSANPTDAARKAFTMRNFILDIQSSVSAIESCLKPTIAVLHGISYGAAIDIATCADIRIAASGTRLSVKEVDIGLAADVGTLTRLPKLGVSHSWVKEVAYTAREFNADEALRVGLVSHVVADKAAALKQALALAGAIAAKSPVAVQGTKRLIDFSRDHSTADGLEYTAVWNGAMLQTEDVQKALMSGLQKGAGKIAFEKL